MANNIVKIEENIRQALCSPPDLTVKEIKTQFFYGKIIFLDGLINSIELEDSVIRPIIQMKKPFADTLEGLKGVISFSGNLKELSEEECLQSVVEGSAVLISGSAFIDIPVKKVTIRAVAEPPTGSVIKGPREGFVEDFRTNIILIRKRVKTPKLIFEKIQMGTLTETGIYLGYIDGVANPQIAERIKERLSKISIDGVLDSSYVTKIIENHPYSIFKQVGNSEKPDIISGKLLDGKVIVIVDGSPIVLYLPFSLIEDFEDVQDNYKRPMRSTFLRYTRLFASFFAMFLPAMFVAVQIYQFQMLPVELLATVINATGNIPFSPTLEMLIAILLFEILGEASIRMPRHVGMALGVVGAIVLGETAVSAGIFSSITVLVVAVSGIGIYAVPDEVGTLSILRALFVVAAGLLGMLGILLSAMCVLAYISTLINYGIPYLMPFAPMLKEDLKDFIVKYNLTDLTRRPGAFSLKNKTRLRRER